MAYATQTDIVTLYSLDALYVADRDGDGVVDGDAVEKALGMASEEIDSFLGVRYPLPLAYTPDLLTQFCVDIAIYRLALGRDVQTEEHRTRYKDVLSHLDRISKGTAALVFPADPNAEPSSLPSGPRPIVSGGPAREFTRAKMRGL